MNNLENMDDIRWGVACFFWLCSLYPIYFNIQRQFKNREYDRNNANRRISGVPFIFTILNLLGASAAPIELTWIVVPGLLFEIPGFVDFKDQQQP